MPLAVRPLARRAPLLGAALLAFGCDDASDPPVGPSTTLGGRIVFARGDGTPAFAAFSVRPDGSDEQPVVGYPQGLASPDLRRGAILRPRDGAPGQCLTVQGADGVERPTAVCGMEFGSIAWSPNGGRLTVRADDSLRVVRMVGERPVAVGAVFARASGAIAWDADGSRFAMVADAAPEDGGATYLVTMSADARPLRTLANVAPGTPLAWSADGGWIAARSGGSTNADAVRIYGPDGGLVGRELVPPGAVTARRSLAFSPDGAHLAFIGNRPGTGDALDLGVGTRDVFVVRVADGALSRVTPVSGDYDTVVWAPDGDRLAYSGTPDVTRLPQPTRDVYVAAAPFGTATTPPPVAITTVDDVRERLLAWF